jgi:hypothetical protein
VEVKQRRGLNFRFRAKSEPDQGRQSHRAERLPRTSHVLQALQQIKCGDAADMKPEHRKRIRFPALLLRRVDAGQAINASLKHGDGLRYLRLSIDQTGDIAAEGFHRRRDQRRE